MSSKFLYSWGGWFGRLFLKPLSRDGWVHRLFSYGAAWTDHRDFPLMDAKPFYKRWASIEQHINPEGKP
jgi:hypothetical protein